MTSATRTVIHTSRSPFELFLLADILLASVGGLLAPARSGRIIQALPPAQQTVALISFAAAAGVALIGASISAWWSLYVERGALMMTAILSLVFTLWVIITAGWSVAINATTLCAFGGACLWRAGQISKDLRRVEAGPT